MLQQIREKFTGGIAIAILALIGVPFLFFGVGLVGYPLVLRHQARRGQLDDV